MQKNILNINENTGFNNFFKLKKNINSFYSIVTLLQNCLLNLYYNTDDPPDSLYYITKLCNNVHQENWVIGQIKQTDIFFKF